MEDPIHLEVAGLNVFGKAPRYVSLSNRLPIVRFWKGDKVGLTCGIIWSYLGTTRDLLTTKVGSALSATESGCGKKTGSFMFHYLREQLQIGSRTCLAQRTWLDKRFLNGEGLQLTDAPKRVDGHKEGHIPGKNCRVHECIGSDDGPRSLIRTMVRF